MNFDLLTYVVDLVPSYVTFTVDLLTNILDLLTSMLAPSMKRVKGILCYIQIPNSLYLNIGASFSISPFDQKTHFRLGTETKNVLSLKHTPRYGHILA